MKSLALQSSLNKLWELITGRYSSRENIKIHEILTVYYNKNPLSEFVEFIKNFSFSNKQILIATGFPILRKSKPETDGPLGAMALAKIFDLLGYSVDIVTDRLYMPVIESLLSLLKLRVKMIHIIPPQGASCSKKLDTLLDFSSFDLAIAVEAPAPNIAGIYHNMHGFNITPIAGNFGLLFNMLSSNNVMTIGIGDGGNEIGMGKIRKLLYEQDVVPFGKVCRCPCKKGILSAVETDYLLSAATSNFGAYALCAILAAKFNLDFFPTPEDEEEMLRVAIDSGAIDGITEKPELKVDGISYEIIKIAIEKMMDIYKEMKKAFTL